MVDCRSSNPEDLKINSDFSPDTFSILNIDCQSLRSKFYLFEQLLYSCNVPFDVICVTETWLNNDEIEFFKIPNFTFSGAQCDSRGGGVGVYVRDGIGVVLVPVVTIFGCDIHSIIG